MPEFPAFINDGYVRQGYLAAVARLHPELRFTYRPMLSANRAVAWNQIAKVDPAKAEEIAAKAVIGHLKSWDLKDGGNNLPMTVVNVLKMEPTLFQKLWRCIDGTLACDEDPLWNEPTKSERDAIEAALNGSSLIEDIDAKNSPAASGS